MNKNLKFNLLTAFAAQGISLIVSITTNLFLPKLLTKLDYSYWQLFLFYCTYVPILSLGLNDGIYLRYGGIERNKLNFSIVKSQLVFGMFYQTVLSISIYFFIYSNEGFSKISLVLFFVLLYYILYTFYNYLSNVFQAINETSKFSKSVIIQKAFFIIVIVFLVFEKLLSVNYIIVLYIISVGVSVVYLMHNIFNNFKNSHFNFKEGFKESFYSIKIGISLLLSNLCSFFVLGIGRQIIEMKWGIITFGKISFSLALMNFALTFISQISMVLFPALRQINFIELRKYYIKLTLGLFIFLPVIYILYIPLQYVLNLWLPKYSESIEYLSILLPICFFDSKMEIVGNTFFKVLKKQNLLLMINIGTVLLNAIISLLSVFVFSSFNGVMLGMVISILFRSIISDVVLNSFFKINILKYDVLDLLLAFIFVIILKYFNYYISFVLICVMCFIRILLLRNKIRLKQGKIDFKF